MGRVFSKRWLRGAVAVGAFPLLGLWLAPWLLCVDDAVGHADAIVLLGGDDGSRTLRAAELYHEGCAPVIIVTGDWEMRPKELMDLRVPQAAILVENMAQSTVQNAEFTVRLMKQHGWTSGLVVTSWSHTRRARWCFRQYGPDMAWSMQPTWQTPEVAAKWGSPASTVLKEYPKFLWYLVRYGCGTAGT